MRKAKQRLRRAYLAGIHRGQSTSPRQAYHRGFVAGKARMDRHWTRKAAAQSHYYYQMGKGSK